LFQDHACLIFRSIVDDDHLEGLMSLREKSVETTSQELGGVIGGDEDGDHGSDYTV